MEITKENIKVLEFFNTTKDLRLEDGSRIEKGTEFKIDGYDGTDKVDIHFSANKNNYYTNETGEGYEFSINQIKEFAEPTTYAIEKYEKQINDRDFVEQGTDEQFLIEQGFIPEHGAIEQYEKEYRLDYSNKFNIQSDNILERIGKIVEGINNIKLKINPIKGEFDFKHLDSINKSLYNCLYELPRIPDDKIKECKNILKDLKKENLSRLNDIDEFADKTMKHISKLYGVNAFQKGNVNTLKEFTRNLGMASGFNIDFSKVSNKAFEFALNSFSNGNFDVLNGIVKDNAINIKPLKDIMKVFEKGMEMGR